MVQSKSTSHSHVLEFEHLTRDVDSHGETIEPLIEQFWYQVPKTLRQREYLHDGCTITVEINWQRFATRLRRDYGLLRPLREKRPPDKDWYSKLSRPLRIQTDVTISGTNELASHQWYPTFFLNTFIHEVFLIANLAVPGSANFYRTSIARPKQRDPTEVRLSAFAFDNGLMNSLDGEWPALQILPGKDVCEWFSALDIGYKQRADTRGHQACRVARPQVDVYAQIAFRDAFCKVGGYRWLRPELPRQATREPHADSDSGQGGEDYQGDHQIATFHIQIL
ncbi:hypothetical protein G2912_37105, partial [Paraburkholderia aspalathi]|nr:hypothetical protein [Paraburkholderia aspalathi]